MAKELRHIAQRLSHAEKTAAGCRRYPAYTTTYRRLFAQGQNVAVEYRWGEGSYALMPDLAVDLVRRRVAVICTTSNVGTLAAKEATSDIPIVFVFGIDPVRMGLVSSLNRH